MIDLNILTGIEPNTALNSPLIKGYIISGATVEEAIGGFNELLNAVKENIPIIGRLQITQYDSIQTSNYIKIGSCGINNDSSVVSLVAPVNQIYQDSEHSIKRLKYSLVVNIDMSNDSVVSMLLPIPEPLASYPESWQPTLLNNVILIGHDSFETIRYKVSAGVPYVYIDGPSSWDETLYSPAPQEQFEEWFYNNCRSGLYKLDDIMSSTYRTTGGTTGETYSLTISSSLVDEGETPMAAVIEENVTRPLLYTSGRIQFQTNENGVWEYHFSGWKMTSFKISTNPIEHVADYGSVGVVLGYTTLNKANGRGSIAEGFDTETSGAYSHAEGNNTITNNSGEHAEGCFNLSNNGLTLHSVGIGSSPEDRKNAHEITVSGDHYIYGLGGYDGTNATADTSQTLQAVINSLSTITVDYNQPTTSYTGSDSTTIYKIFDLSSLKYTEGNDIILINGAQRLKYQYAYGETQAATVQVNESTSIEYNLINILSPLITNIFSLEELTIVHGKINAETDEKYYLIIKAVPTV